MDVEKLSFHIKKLLKSYKLTNTIPKILYPDFFYKIRFMLTELVTTSLIEQISYWGKYGIRVESSAEFNECIHKIKKEQIGDGFFGTVYKVPVKSCIKNIPKGVTTVAVKYETINLSNYNHTPEKLQETISITKKVAELKIGPQLYDVFVVKVGETYVLIKIYEYVEGTTWNKHVFKSKKNYNKAISTLEQYIRTINKNGILHKDLHNENVMITADERIYIIDFDLASYVSNFDRNNIIYFYKNRTNQINYIEICTTYVYNELVKQKIIKISNKTYKK